MDKGLCHIAASGMFNGIFEVVIHDMPRDTALRYVDRLREKYHIKGLTFRAYLDGEPQSRLFTSVESRDILERALLQKGAYICSLPSTPNERLKPMGYNHTFSMGY